VYDSLEKKLIIAYSKQAWYHWTGPRV